MSNTLNIQPTSTTKETRDEVIARAAAAASATGSSPLKSSLRKWAPLPSAQNTNGPYQRVVPEAASYDKKQLSKSASDLSTDREEASLGTSQDTAQDETTEGSKEKVEEKVEEQYVGLTEVNSILLEIHESYERKNRELKAGSDAMSRELIKLRAHNAAVRRGAHAGSPDNPSEMRKELIELSQQLMESVAREKVAEESLQKLLSERDEAYSEDPKSSAFTREVVFDLSRECAELRRLYRAEIDEKQALQEELALLRSKVVHVTDLEAKCFAVTEELATMRFDMNRAELAYDKLRSDYDHEILLVDELKGECSDLRIELHRLCEDYDDVCASSRERELDDRDKLERLLNAYYTLRDDFESSQEGGMMDEDEETQRRMRGDDAPNVEASLRSNYDSLSSSGIVPGIAFVRKTRKASASTAPVAGSLGGNFFLKNANINI